MKSQNWEKLDFETFRIAMKPTPGVQVQEFI
jgi:hypothetical protein